MKGPRRLVEDNELFARLVSEYERSAPPPEALRTMIETLESAKGPLATGSTRSLGLFAKLRPWALLAVVGSVGLVSSTFLAVHHSTGPSPKPVATTIARAPAITSTAPTSESAPPLVPSMAIGDLPNSPAAEAAVATPRGRVTPPAPSASTTTKPSLRREIELIAKAREALTKGDSATCLETLATHDAEFPNGKFMPEAKVMRIDATLANGDRQGARALARRFLASDPDSPYATRLRSLLASTENE